MASAKQLMGTEFVMVDKTTLVTEVITDPNRMSQCISIIMQDMIDQEDMVASLDITWFTFQSDDGLLAICTCKGCVLVRIKSSCFDSLRPLLENKDITFVGVYMKEDVGQLGVGFSQVRIRNAVDLRELAAVALNQPRLRSLGVRKLASEVLLKWNFKPRSLSMTRVIWRDTENLKEDDIECVTTDAYAAYKLGKKLLGNKLGFLSVKFLFSFINT